MNRRPFQFAIALLWLAVPLLAFQYWSVWDQLPARMASHFNAAGQPNGWMSRELSAQFACGLMVFLLAVFTIILWVMSRTRIETFAWIFLGFCALVVGLVAALNQQVITYNLNGSPICVAPFLIAIPAGVVALSAFFLGSKRGQALPASEVLVEETHSGRVWALLFVPALLTPLITLRLMPNTAVRLSMILVIGVVLAAIAMVWTGFRYRFLQHGLEISALGYRLRSIPRKQILSYSVETWSPLRGYGIRGIGNNRAFVWGNQVVHIRTTNGEVYLGHNDPDRIVRDLDLVTGHRQPEIGFGKGTVSAH